MLLQLVQVVLVRQLQVQQATVLLEQIQFLIIMVAQ
jgi:hypothetical protein